MLSELALHVLLRRSVTPPRPAPTVTVADQSGTRLQPNVDLRAGDVLMLTGRGFLPRRPVHVQPFDASDPPPTEITAEDDGSVRVVFTVPGLSAGAHVLALVGVVPDAVSGSPVSAVDTSYVSAGVPQLATFPFTTGAQGATAANPSGLAYTSSGLAYTGGDVRRLAVLGAAFAASGLGLLALARYRSRPRSR